MKTTSRSLSLVLDDDLVEAIDEVRILARGESIPSRSEIVRLLLIKGLASMFAGTEHDPSVGDTARMQ